MMRRKESKSEKPNAVERGGREGTGGGKAGRRLMYQAERVNVSHWTICIDRVKREGMN